MPAGHSARCRVCNSPHRAQIEDWIAEGLSPREIAVRLAAFGESLSHVAIWRHKTQHFDVRAEAALKYAQKQRELSEAERARLAEAQARLDKAAERRVSDVERLDDLIARNDELHRRALAWAEAIVEARDKLPKALVDLIAATGSEVRQAIRTKLDLLGDDPASRQADAIQTLVDLVALAAEAQADDGNEPAGASTHAPSD